MVVTDKSGVESMFGLTAGHSIVQDDLEDEIETEQANEELNAARNLLPDLTTFAPLRVLESAESPTMRNATYNLTTDSRESIEWSGTADVASASFSTRACDRDWALLEAISEPPGSGNQDGQAFERYVLGDPKPYAVSMDDNAETSLQPPFIGQLSSLPSFAILSYGNDFVRVHTITIRNAQSK